MKAFATGGGNPVLLLGAELFDAVPVVLAASQNDFALDGQVSLARLQLLANLNVTGVAGAVGNRLITFQNDSTFVATFVHQSGVSAARNRLNNGANGDMAIGASGFISYLYNPRTLLWDLFAF